MHIYLAGPMRGHHHYNFPSFDSAAKQLRAHGHTIMSPADMDRADGFDETRDTLESFDLEAAIFRDLRAVIDTDCTCLLPGWETSQGATLERQFAMIFQKQVRTLDGLLSEPKPPSVSTDQLQPNHPTKTSV